MFIFLALCGSREKWLLTNLGEWIYISSILFTFYLELVLILAVL